MYQKILKMWMVPEGKSTEQAWTELEQKLSTGSAKGRVVEFHWRRWASVAAAAVAIVAIFFIWPKNKLIRRDAAAAQWQVIELPDQSKVHINAASYVEYSEDWSKDRTIHLSGQAFFEVQKGSKFTVETDYGNVQVLGTSFDVMAREEKFKVQCFTGKVEVSSDGLKALLEPGAVAELKTGNMQVTSFDVDQSNWRGGDFFYHDEPLVNVFKELERQFGVIISLPDLKDKYYNGPFSNKSLDDALALICSAMSLSFEKTDDKHVIITKNPA